MSTQIGEDSKFTFDIKFMATIAAVIISACGSTTDSDSAAY